LNKEKELPHQNKKQKNNSSNGKSLKNEYQMRTRSQTKPMATRSSGKQAGGNIGK